MKKRMILLVLILHLAVPVLGADGLIALKSPHDAQTTMARLKTILQQQGMTIFARIDHAADAQKIGQDLRPTEVIIFGNPKGGTPFMQCAQTVGIDLPLKALVWQEADGQVWLGYNDPAYLGKRHGAENCPVVDKLGGALAAIGAAVIAP